MRSQAPLRSRAAGGATTCLGLWVMVGAGCVSQGPATGTGGAAAGGVAGGGGAAGPPGPTGSVVKIPGDGVDVWQGQ
jgi:hypothetical protein